MHCYLIESELARRLDGFGKEIKAAEDWDFWFRAAVSGTSLVCIPKGGIEHRKFYQKQ